MSEMRKGTLQDIKNSAAMARGQIDRIYYHWSAGVWKPNHIDLADYHVLVLKDGSLLLRDDFTETIDHTWHRNSGSIGVAFAGCCGATTNNMGDYAPTDAQILSMAAVTAVIAIAFGVEVSEDRFMTHGEIAMVDGYGPGQGDPDLRWDLMILRTGDKWWSGGKAVRILAREYVKAFSAGQNDIAMTVDEAIAMATKILEEEERGA